MSLLKINQTQANIIKHQESLQKELNRAISVVERQVAELEKLVSYFHEESVLNELINTRDRNSLLRYAGRKADAIAVMNTKLATLKALKGVNNTETTTNMGAHITNTSYVHDDYKVNFEGE